MKNLKILSMNLGRGFVPIKESQYSNNVQEGNVIGYKNRSKGSKLEYGSQITILVSKGKR